MLTYRNAHQISKSVLLVILNAVSYLIALLFGLAPLNKTLKKIPAGSELRRF